MMGPKKRPVTSNQSSIVDVMRKMIDEEELRRMCQMTVKSELQTLFRCFLVNSQLLQIAAINSAHCVNEAGMFC
jgi:hypothetical protein